eukprot:g13125.t1
MANSTRLSPPLKYGINESVMKPHILKMFVQSAIDKETEVFLETYCSETESSVRSALATMARKFMSQTDTNAFIGRGQMFVFSAAQLESLLANAFEKDRIATISSGMLLEIGAGNGDVTEKYQKFVRHITATEVSKYMVKLLEKKDCIDRVVETGSLNSFDVNEKFQIISCLNVLDRCDKPSQLLKDIHARLDPQNGILVVAIVLPWCPFVENGTRKDCPTEDLEMDGGRCRTRNTFEEAVNVIVDNVFLKHGFVVKSWTRVPYICAGDTYQKYYVLSDALFVLECQDSAASC